MQILFSKNELYKALNIVQKAAQNRINSNIPGCIYMTTRDSYVEIQSNDFEIAFRVTVDAEIIEPGTILLPSKFFLDIIKRMPSETIKIEYDPYDTQNNAACISSGTSEYKMVVYPEDNFTLIEPIRTENELHIDTMDLKTLIDLTAYAISTDDSRPIFTGTLLDVKGSEVTMVGTDTHRLAMKKICLSEPASNELSSVIPSRVLQELARLLPVDQPQMVKIIWNKTQVAFLFENVYLLSRFVDGKFPDYEKIVPQQFYANAKLNRKELISTLERVSVFASDNNYTAIKYEWMEDKVILSSHSIDFGSAREEISCDFKGTPFTITFNGRYILDVLKKGTGDFVHFNLTDRGPLVVRLDDNVNYTYVATPIRSQ